MCVWCKFQKERHQFVEEEMQAAKDKLIFEEKLISFRERLETGVTRHDLGFTTS